MGEMGNAYIIFVGRPERKRPLGRPKRKWEDIIRIDRREIRRVRRCGVEASGLG
jgi:hypothetical protein